MYRVYRSRKQGENHLSEYSIREAPTVDKQANGVQLYDDEGAETYFIPWHRVDEILNLETVTDDYGDLITNASDPTVPDFS